MAINPEIDFVGIGNMGWRLALVHAGFTVDVNDSRCEVANNFVQQGRRRCPGRVAGARCAIGSDHHRAADQHHRAPGIGRGRR